MTHIEAMKQALEDNGLYEITGQIEDIDKCVLHRSVVRQIHDEVKANYLQRQAIAEESSATQESDWSKSETGLVEMWKNPLYSMADRLQMADGAVAFKDKVIDNLRVQLAEQEPKREWVGLTQEEILNLGAGIVNFEYVAAIEAKLKEKNT